MKDHVRVRFAPSPTGELHLGNARTAIFNWLFARSLGGTFILRIEDTDQERSRREYTQLILDELTWLGIDWDEGPRMAGAFGPYLQSERLGIYQDFAKKLKENGLTYPCYCSAEELEARRQEAMGRGDAPRYDNRCRTLTLDQIRHYEKEGRRFAIRFKVESGHVVIDDLVRGRVEFDTSLFGDFVIFKSDGYPTFHFAVAVDDGLMKISHVVRGEDHLSNTPRHILLFRAMDFEVPKFAHLSMILGSDGSRLSKRHGAASVAFYREAGYLPSALINYLTLLGWSSGDDREIFSKEELTRLFSLDRIVGSAAIFNAEKLHWMGEQHIKRSEKSSLVKYMKEKYSDELNAVPDEKMASAIDFMRDRAGTLNELKKEIEVFIRPPDLLSPDSEKIFSNPDAFRILEGIMSVLERDWPNGDFPVKSLSACQKNLGVAGAVFYMTFRFSLTGHIHGPELKDFCPKLGQEEVLNRLKRALEFMKGSARNVS